MTSTIPPLCVVCRRQLSVRARSKLYCSTRCRSNHLSATTNALNGYHSGLRVSTGVVGAIAELAVSADLLRRGYHVFRAVSQSCPCDLVALTGTQVFRIEVRTGYRNQAGKVCANLAEPDKADGTAVFIHRSNEIVYIDASRADWSAINDADCCRRPEPAKEALLAAIASIHQDVNPKPSERPTGGQKP